MADFGGTRNLFGGRVAFWGEGKPCLWDGKYGGREGPMPQPEGVLEAGYGSSGSLLVGRHARLDDGKLFWVDGKPFSGVRQVGWP